MKDSRVTPALSEKDQGAKEDTVIGRQGRRQGQQMGNQLVSWKVLQGKLRKGEGINNHRDNSYPFVVSITHIQPLLEKYNHSKKSTQEGEV